MSYNYIRGLLRCTTTGSQNILKINHGSFHKNKAVSKHVPEINIKKYVLISSIDWTRIRQAIPFPAHSFKLESRYLFLAATTLPWCQYTTPDNSGRQATTRHMCFLVVDKFNHYVAKISFSDKFYSTWKLSRFLTWILKRAMVRCLSTLGDFFRIFW